jgi:hypothetical protein
MEMPDQLRELFRMQTALNQRIRVKNAINFQRQESAYSEKEHGDPKHI